MGNNWRKNLLIEIIGLAMIAILVPQFCLGEDQWALQDRAEERGRQAASCATLKCEDQNATCSQTTNDNGHYYCVPKTTEQPKTTKEIEELIPPKNSIHIPYLKYTTIDPKTALDDQGYLYLPWIGNFLSAAYKTGIAVGSLVAVVMIILEGIRIVTSGGGEGKNEGIKNIGRIGAGLVILWGSFLILNTINPKLVSFNALRIKNIPTMDVPVFMLTDDSISPGSSHDISEGSKTVSGKLVPYFNQTDPAWKSCSPAGDIQRAGCGITSIAMVLKYYGQNVDPCSLYRNNNNKVIVSMDKYVTGNIDYAPIKFDVNVINTINRCLDANIPVIIYTTAAPFTKRFHFMVITGREGETYNINNPSGSQKTMTREQMLSPGSQMACKDIQPTRDCGDYKTKPFPDYRILYNKNEYNADCTKK
ncbi:MAG: C39 family peptidase [Candidatus Magasanikbacteria bacterium]|jgi:hypothetical protein